MRLNLLRLSIIAAVVAIPTLDDMELDSAPAPKDACAIVAADGDFTTVTHARNCLKSIPFNETIRKATLDTITATIPFYAFKDILAKYEGGPFSIDIDIEAELERIASSEYDSDYDFHSDLFQSFLNLVLKR